MNVRHLLWGFVAGLMAFVVITQGWPNLFLQIAALLFGMKVLGPLLERIGVFK